MWEIILHGLKPNKPAELPLKTFMASHISLADPFAENLCLQMYNESAQRINGLEDKGFKLLMYISAISAISIYFISKDISGLFKGVVIISLFFHVLAIIISFRCISV